MAALCLDSRYGKVYTSLMERAKSRTIPTCYTEVHHIVPRSLGGPDDSANLVRLTYREHFLAHWLLTKFLVAGDLRKMQRALFAMTLPVSGSRITAGWQFELAKRAIRDLELDPVAEQEWRDRWRIAQSTKTETRRASIEAEKLKYSRALELVSSKDAPLDVVKASLELLLKAPAQANLTNTSDPNRPRKRERRPRQSKRARELAKASA